MSLRDLVYRPGEDGFEVDPMPYYPDRDPARMETLPYYPSNDPGDPGLQFLNMILDRMVEIARGPELPDLPIERLPYGSNEEASPESTRALREYMNTPGMQRRYNELRRKYNFGV